MRALFAGRVIVEGIGVLGGSRATRMHRRRTGMVFQQHQLIGRATVLSNVLTGRLSYHSGLRTLFPLPMAEKRLALDAIERIVYSSCQSGDYVFLIGTCALDMTGFLQNHESRIDGHLILLAESLSEFSGREVNCLESKSGQFMVDAADQIRRRHGILRRAHDLPGPVHAGR